jgi:hypothetical protein
MPSRPIKSRTFVCRECTKKYHPYHLTQRFCSRSCMGAFRGRTDPRILQRLELARARGRELYAKRLGQRIKGLTPGQIWREAYDQGWRSAYQKFTRQQAKRAA